MSSKSPLVKLCAFWVPSEAFMSGVPAFILGCRWTLHFYKECLRVGLPWCALGCRTGFLSQRTMRSPKSPPTLAIEETQEILCIWECWDLLKCADANTERSVWAVGTKQSPSLPWAQRQGNEPGERGLSVSLFSSPYSLQCCKRIWRTGSRSLDYMYSPSSLVCRVWGFMYLCFLFFVLFIII